LRGSGGAWITRCVINAARDVQRRGMRRPEAPADVGDGDGAGATAAAGFDPLLALVREAVRRLPPRQRDVLFLRHYLGFGYTEIAQALEVEVVDRVGDACRRPRSARRRAPGGGAMTTEAELLDRLVSEARWNENWADVLRRTDSAVVRRRGPRGRPVAGSRSSRSSSRPCWLRSRSPQRTAGGCSEPAGAARSCAGWRWSSQQAEAADRGS
jgi:hypothetical protein